MNKPDKKAKRPIGPFSFCPKHSVFFASCGCKWKKGKKEKEQEEDEEAEEDKNTIR